GGDVAVAFLNTADQSPNLALCSRGGKVLRSEMGYSDTVYSRQGHRRAHQQVGTDHHLRSGVIALNIAGRISFGITTRLGLSKCSSIGRSIFHVRENVVGSTIYDALYTLNASSRQ